MCGIAGVVGNEEGSLWITCNGEIYNYRELRRGRLDRDHELRAHTDTAGGTGGRRSGAWSSGWQADGSYGKSIPTPGTGSTWTERMSEREPTTSPPPAFLYGLAAADLGFGDPDYELLLRVRAVRDA